MIGRHFGSKVDPSFDPWLAPHSCGQTCSKALQPECGHDCLLLCHPGETRPLQNVILAMSQNWHTVH